MSDIFAKNYANYYNLIYSKKPYKEEAEFVYKWANKPPLIIDLGCGTGKHHKYWKAFTIGIDQSIEMLKKVIPSRKNIYYKWDINNLAKEFSGFKCYTALFNVIGYCNLEKILEKLNQPKGGIFIFDVWDMDKCCNELFHNTIKQFRGGKVLIKPDEWDGNDCRLKISVHTKDNKCFTEYHTCIPYSEYKIKELCYKFRYCYEKKPTSTWAIWYKLTKR